jgi:inosine/xanthosine triphosphate pyrophosphatase family protein
VFYTPRWAKTFAEIPLELKNTVSHRARAMAQMADFLKTYAPRIGRPG